VLIRGQQRQEIGAQRQQEMTRQKKATGRHVLGDGLGVRQPGDEELAHEFHARKLPRQWSWGDGVGGAARESWKCGDTHASTRGG
jgi:hypothetical protein